MLKIQLCMKKGILVIYLRHINYLSYNYLNEVTIWYNLRRLFPIKLWSLNMLGQILMIDQTGLARKSKWLLRPLDLRLYTSTNLKSNELNMLEHVQLSQKTGFGIKTNGFDTLEQFGYKIRENTHFGRNYDSSLSLDNVVISWYSHQGL